MSDNPTPTETPETSIMQDTTIWPRCPYCNKPVDTEAHPIRYATCLIDMGPDQPYSVYQVIYCGYKKCHKVLSFSFIGAREKSDEQKQREAESQAPPPVQAPILHSGARAIAELNNIGKPRPMRFKRTFGPN